MVPFELKNNVEVFDASPVFLQQFFVDEDLFLVVNQRIFVHDAKYRQIK
jgi:hypothetical protein